MSKAKGGLTSLTNENNDESPPLFANTHTTAHASPLLRLPGELKNRVFELAISTKATIILRADSDRTSQGLYYKLCIPERGDLTNANGPLRYKFHPTPPGILATCRELRADALALYYNSNTFLFSDTMFQPKALEAFATARPAAKKHIRKVKVSHEVSPMYCFGIKVPDSHRFARSRQGEVQVRASECSSEFRVTFWAALRADGLDVLGVSTKGPKIIHYDDGEAAGLCCCTLMELAQGYGCGAAQEAGSVMDMLVKYGGLLDDHDRLVRVRKVKGEEYAPSVGAKLCLRCRRVKAI